MSYSNMAMLALFIHAIIHFNVITNTHYHHGKPTANAYRWFILSVMGFYISDTFWGIFYDAHLTTAVFIDTTVYFIAMAASVFTWTRYVVLFLNTGKRTASVLSAVGWMFLALFGVFLALNCFTPIMFWLDEEGIYHAGDMRYAMLSLQVMLFAASSVYSLIRVRKAETNFKRRYIATGVSGIVMSAMVILQVLYPLLPLYSVGCLLVTCILHHFVINDMEETRRRELEEMLRREQEQERELGSAKHLAYTDSLTGVKNTHAYIEKEKQVDERIARGELKEFGVIVFDLNGLKQVNDTKGHEAGDSLIQDACRLICHKFKHSPVYRIGGDEFVVMLEGDDYRERKNLVAEFDGQIEENIQNGFVVVASGLAVLRPGHDNSYRRIFERADQRMYDRKGALKAMET